MSETIFIVTPCFNSVETIDRTIQSVISQAGSFFIRYHIQDGGSSDGTLERLQWWSLFLKRKGALQANNGIEFSYSSNKDAGMYDAICKGFRVLRPSNDAFTTWINSDDIFYQGAFELINKVAQQFDASQVSWIGGPTSIFNEDLPTLTFSNPIPKQALRSGLCDGKHWNFLQQEGVFFRSWLWKSIDPEKTIVPMTLAGDWNLWRLFSDKSTLVQTPIPIACFRRVENQLSARFRDKYMAEIDSIIPEKVRKQALKKIAESSSAIFHRTINASNPDKFTINDHCCTDLAKYNVKKVFKEDEVKISFKNHPNKLIYSGKKVEDIKPVNTYISDDKGIFAYDHEWQFPAITEQHAFKQVTTLLNVPDNTRYIAYPWATLIDKLQTRSSDANLYKKRFYDFISLIPKGFKLITVCQHIKMKEYLYLFEEAGIDVVFWTHATHEDISKNNDNSNLKIKQFPLYPVQIPDANSLSEITERKFLFSFIGAKSNQYYLTDSRTKILEILQDDPRGLVIGRNEWHYNKVVYELQIRAGGTSANSEDFVNKTKSEQFKESLAESIFSLCPSGSGPNSIRLWESLGAGCIPVILADTYAPPGNERLWKEGVVFCEENAESIAALPEKLENIARDKETLKKMQSVCKQLWLLYGPENFVYDIEKEFLMNSLQPLKQARNEAPHFWEIITKKLLTIDNVERADWLSLLRTLSSELLLGNSELRTKLEDQSTRISQLVSLATENLPKTDETLLHFENVLKLASTKSIARKTAFNRSLSKQKLKIKLLGGHSHRTPLSYESFQLLASKKFELCENENNADVLLTGFNIDFTRDKEKFKALVQAEPAKQFTVISEEPLWDVNWAGGFEQIERSVDLDGTKLNYKFFNHHNSNVFRTEKIPYFILTDNELLSRYTTLIGRSITLTPEELLKRWDISKFHCSFVAEKRTGDKYSLALPDKNIWGLSAYRSDVAEAVSKLKPTYIEGKGWYSDANRQDLPDWHLDKLAKLDSNTTLLSGLENTHQVDYVSEKIFDAFATGSFPVYYACPTHKVHNLVKPLAMLNTFGLSAPDASQKIANFKPSIENASAWLESAKYIHSLFSDSQLVETERTNVIERIYSLLKQQ